MVVFVPLAEPCYFALSPLHAHPTNMFVYGLGKSTGIYVGTREHVLNSNEFYYFSPKMQPQELQGDDIPKYIALFIKPDLMNSIFTHYGVDGEEEIFNRVYKPDNELLVLQRMFISKYRNQLPGMSHLLSAIEIQIGHSIVHSINRP